MFVNIRCRMIVFTWIQLFGCDASSSLGRVYSRQATVLNCVRSPVSFILKYCPFQPHSEVLHPYKICRRSKTFPVERKTMKKHVWHTLKSNLCMQESLVQDNGHSLVPVPKRSGDAIVQKSTQKQKTWKTVDSFWCHSRNN